MHEDQTRVGFNPHSPIKNWPVVYQCGSLRYEVYGTTDDGSLLFRTLDGKTFKLDPDRDLNDVITEGLDNGIFFGDGSVEANPNGTVLRCEAIFELWRTVGEGRKVSGIDLGDEVVGEESYYRDAVAWLYSVGGRRVEGLYNYRDLEGSITWLELAYLLYGVLGVRSCIKWSKIRPGDVKVTIITDEVSGNKVLNTHLPAYKQGRWMRSYLRDMQSGKRYLPFPAYCCFVNMVEDGIHPSEPTPVVGEDGRLTMSGGFVEDVNGSSRWCLLEVSRSDFKSAIEKAVTLC